MALEGLSPKAFRQSEVFHNLNDKGPASFDSIRKALDDNFYNGDIDKPLYENAIAQLEKLEKASKGEGSKGGKVIGHTRSGKAVYAANKSNSYKDFSPQDHRDAASIHRDESSNVRQRPVHRDNDALAGHHWQTASGHYGEAEKKEKEQHQSSLHPDEKKIVEADKKERIEKHTYAYEQHSASAKRHKKLAEDMKNNPFAKSHHEEQVADHEYKATYHKSQKEHYEKD